MHAFYSHSVLNHQARMFANGCVGSCLCRQCLKSVLPSRISHLSFEADDRKIRCANSVIVQRVKFVTLLVYAVMTFYEQTNTRTLCTFTSIHNTILIDDCNRSQLQCYHHRFGSSE